MQIGMATLMLERKVGLEKGASVPPVHGRPAFFETTATHFVSKCFVYSIPI
jgi:hypothetical protein